jgi:hypothetical protein
MRRDWVHQGIDPGQTNARILPILYQGLRWESEQGSCGRPAVPDGYRDDRNGRGYLHRRQAVIRSDEAADPDPAGLHTAAVAKQFLPQPGNVQRCSPQTVRMCSTALGVFVRWPEARFGGLHLHSDARPQVAVLTKLAPPFRTLRRQAPGRCLGGVRQAV